MIARQDLKDEHLKNLRIIKECGYSEDQNIQIRNTMEDRHFIADDIMGDGNVGLYGVLDGHGGVHVVDYCLANIPRYFKQQYKQGCDIKTLFTDIFYQIDSDLNQKVQTATEQGSCCCIILIRSEATIIPVKQKKCYIINLGDCRAVLNQQQKAKRLSNDHKAVSNQDEIQRIKDYGGIVLKGRVSGQLAVTRALGDLSLKQEGVICTPEVTSFEITDKTKDIIVGTDGLFDVCEDQQAVDIVCNSKNCLVAAQSLKNYALKNGSYDNTSVMVLKL